MFKGSCHISPKYKSVVRKGSPGAIIFGQTSFIDGPQTLCEFYFIQFTLPKAKKRDIISGQALRLFR